MLEKDLQKQILDYLSYKKGKYWRVNSGAVVAENKGKKRFFRFNSINGVSDIIGINKEGIFIAIEVKVKPNKLTQEQKDFIDMVNFFGGIGIVAYKLEDVSMIIK